MQATRRLHSAFTTASSYVHNHTCTLLSSCNLPIMAPTKRTGMRDRNADGTAETNLRAAAVLAKANERERASMAKKSPAKAKKTSPVKGSKVTKPAAVKKKSFPTKKATKPPAAEKKASPAKKTTKQKEPLTPTKNTKEPKTKGTPQPVAFKPITKTKSTAPKSTVEELKALVWPPLQALEQVAEADRELYKARIKGIRARQYEGCYGPLASVIGIKPPQLIAEHASLVWLARYAVNSLHRGGQDKFTAVCVEPGFRELDSLDLRAHQMPFWNCETVRNGDEILLGWELRNGALDLSRTALISY